MSDEMTRGELRLVRAVETAFEPYRHRAAAPLPRRKRPWPMAAAAVAVVAVAVAVAVAWPSSSALASWTAAPTSSDPTELADATAEACIAQSATLIRVGREAGWPADPSLEPMQSTPLVAYDQRGEASAALFADEDGRAAWICVIIPVAGQPPYVELTGGTGTIPDDLGPVEIWTASGGWNSDYGGRWEIAGRVDDTVERIAITREDGESVTATIDDGWFLAWWPSESEAVGIDVLGAGGQRVERIDLGGRFAHEPSCRFMVLDLLCLWSGD